MIKRYIKNYQLFEAVIPALDFNSFFNEANNLNTFDELIELGKEYSIHFINYNTFYNEYLDTQKERQAAPPDGGGLSPYIKFALYSAKFDAYVFVISDRFKSDFKNALKRDYGLLNEILRHESIHQGQHKRSGGKSYSLERSPRNRKDYFSHYTEIMAYAHSLVDQLNHKGLTKDQILNHLKRGTLPSWVNNVYANMEPKVKKRFYNYVYSYIMLDNN